jgi:hypothetical protein
MFPILSLDCGICSLGGATVTRDPMDRAKIFGISEIGNSDVHMEKDR